MFVACFVQTLQLLTPVIVHRLYNPSLGPQVCKMHMKTEATEPDSACVYECIYVCLCV